MESKKNISLESNIGLTESHYKTLVKNMIKNSILNIGENLIVGDIYIQLGNNKFTLSLFHEMIQNLLNEIISKKNHHIPKQYLNSKTLSKLTNDVINTGNTLKQSINKEYISSIKEKNIQKFENYLLMNSRGQFQIGNIDNKILTYIYLKALIARLTQITDSLDKLDISYNRKFREKMNSLLRQEREILSGFIETLKKSNNKDSTIYSHALKLNSELNRAKDSILKKSRRQSGNHLNVIIKYEIINNITKLSTQFVSELTIIKKQAYRYSLN